MADSKKLPDPDLAQGNSGRSHLNDIPSEVNNEKSTPSGLDMLVEKVPFNVKPRIEEDIICAYRSYFRDQISVDKRNELGRFLFGVSFATMGIFISIIKLSSPQVSISGLNSVILVLFAAIVILSALIALRLAIPRNQTYRKLDIDITELHRSNSLEIFRNALAWFIAWSIAVAIGSVLLFAS